MDSTLKRTWAEIDLDALSHNYHMLCEKIGSEVKFLGVVKADAYGHGSVQVSRLLQELGADYLAVSSIDEAVELRHNNITMPILILGHTPKEQVSQLIKYHNTPGRAPSFPGGILRRTPSYIFVKQRLWNTVKKPSAVAAPLKFTSRLIPECPGLATFVMAITLKMVWRESVKAVLFQGLMRKESSPTLPFRMKQVNNAVLIRSISSSSLPM